MTDKLKKISNIQPIVLCGGSGTRLWPISRKSLPKQFVELFGEKSLLQLTFERLDKIFHLDKIIALANEDHRFFVGDIASKANIKLQAILEPVGRNTAPAMAIAALNSPDDELLFFVPSDHFIPDAETIKKSLLNGIDAARAGDFVVFGVKPTHPNTAYGYIKVKDTDTRNILKVEKFLEKPDQINAKLFFESGNYYWNSGMFLVKKSVLLKAIRTHAEDIFQSVNISFNSQKIDGDFIHLAVDDFARCRSESIDFAILENIRNISMSAFDGNWSDVGSWNALADLKEGDKNDNKIIGKGYAFDTKSTYILAKAKDRNIVTIGIKDLIVVDTSDALLITHKSSVEEVKKAVEALTIQKIPQATENSYACRPWGDYEILDQGSGFKVKRITVKPGASLSLQLHYKRAEHWIVVEGTAKITRDEDTFTLEKNQSTYIPLGTKHRLENIGTIPLQIIEVQSGNYLEEDDIVRFEDNYGR